MALPKPKVSHSKVPKGIIRMDEAKFYNGPG
jgi:hypothetical protein